MRQLTMSRQCSGGVVIILASLVTFSGGGCQGRDTAETKIKSSALALNLSPKSGDFVLEAQNSIRLQTAGVVVASGDLGARGTGSGPFLSGGVAIDLLTGVRTPTTRNVIADSIRLGTGVTVGDIETNRFVDGTGTHHGMISGLVPLPALPAAALVSPGNSNLTVATGATLSAVPGRYATVTIGTGGKLRLAGGTYDVAALSMSTGARIEALAAVQLHIASRMSTSTGTYIGGASGTSLVAADFRIEVSGMNGTNGGLTETPPAASIGTSANVTALILVPNGTLLMGTGVTATGAFMARDVDVAGVGTTLVFQSGFQSCTASSCDDGNPCTVDVCGQGGECSHSSSPAGTACGDGNGCNGDESCDGNGNCGAGTPVICLPGPCQEVGTCDSATGLCSFSAKADGSTCSDGDACTQGDTCRGGTCVAGVPIMCPPSPSCQVQPACDPSTGQCSAAGNCSVCGNGVLELGEACDDGNSTVGDGCSPTCKLESCGDGIVQQTFATLKFSWLGRSCGAEQPTEIVFTLNDIEVARSTLTNSCDCAPAVGTVAVEDPRLLALGKNGTSIFGVRTTGELAWAVVHVDTPSSRREQKIWDGNVDYDPSNRPLDMCTTGTQIGVTDVTSMGFWEGEDCDDGNADDNDACTNDCKTNLCYGKVCITPARCQDLPGTCDRGTGQCQYTAQADGTACDDGSACTRQDTCAAGVCVGGNPVSCPISPACELQPTCDPSTGQCSAAGNCAVCGNGVQELGEECDDGNATAGDGCNLACKREFCGDGVVQQTFATLKFSWLGRSCGSEQSAEIVFTLNDVEVARSTLTPSCDCVPGVGTVAVTDSSLLALGKNGTSNFGVRTSGELAWAAVHVDTPSTAREQKIWDGNGDYDPSHKPTDMCAAGTRVGVTDVTGMDFWEGEECDDGNADDSDACTNDCRRNLCYGNPCSAPAQCQDVPGTCDRGTGQCQYPPKADGTLCNDGNVCTRQDTCVAGACVGSNPVSCPAAPTCEVQPACDPSTGQCSAAGNCAVCGNGVQELGEECDDGNATAGDGCNLGCKREFCGDGVVQETFAPLRFSWLGRSCDSAQTAEIVFALNDVEVARSTLASSCDCLPGVGTVAVTDPGLLALGKNGTSVFRVTTTGELAWALVHVDTPSTKREQKIWDGNVDYDPSHQPVDMCAAATRVGVSEVTNMGFWEGEACDDGNTNNDDGCSNSCLTNNCYDVVCQPQDQCHLAGTCDPGTGQCSNPVKSDGATCDDGNACTSGDVCTTGVCVGQNHVVCPTGDQCNGWQCNPAAGGCVEAKLADGKSCDDGNACTTSDVCRSGTCAGENTVTCVASDQCHAPGTCDPGSGACSNPPKADGAGCNDGNPCTLVDTCQAGTCSGGNPVTCLALDQCHDAGTCNPATGVCSNPAKANGAACDDGNPCTRSDTCSQGICSGGNPVTCAASDQCHAIGVCDPSTGACSNPIRADGVACNDGNSCTRIDTCVSGSCVGAQPVICAAKDQCHDAGICDPGTGACSNPAKTDGAACNDGNGCTVGDICQAGTCTPGQPKPCVALDACHVAGTCSPSTGVCSNPTAANGTTCNDGNPCTQTDTCQAGSCVGSAPVACAAADQCHEAGICNSATGVCVYATKPDGSLCTDNNLCTRTDTCQGGACVGGNPIYCGAGNQCQDVGECDVMTGGCLFAGKSDGTACDDGDASTSGDACHTGVCVGIPTQPPSVAANLATALAPIYQGSEASQIGVAAGTIQNHRAAGISGHIFDGHGLPLEAVKLTIAGHGEFGRAMSRVDGGYDMVVNGGGPLTIQMTKSGYLPVDRVVDVPWQGFGHADDAVMLQVDAQVTTVDLSQPVVQVAAGSVVSDKDGTRRATILVPRGTQAVMGLPSGATAPLGTLSIHATEYTVGDSGPSAMPAPLPSYTAYTYAVDYAVDEALAVGAKMVHFSQPVYHTSENFLGFPVGSPIPAGYYDHGCNCWVPSVDGRVIAVLSVDGGVAQLDVSGSGTPADAVTLQALGVTDDELAVLAQRYLPGQSLWRVPIAHFSTWDYNWPFGPSPGAGPPNGGSGSNAGGGPVCSVSAGAPNGSGPPPLPGDPLAGSIIETTNQVLGERTAILGTPFSLNYRSNRMVGFKAANHLDISLIKGAVPATLKKVSLKIDVAGQHLEQSFDPQADLSTSFLWNGMDQMGRVVNGRQFADVTIGYVYPLQYTQPPPQVDIHVAQVSFNQFSDKAVAVDAVRGRLDFTAKQSLSHQTTGVGKWLATSAGLGGWTLDVNHVYDPGRILWRGDGERETGKVNLGSDMLLPWKRPTSEAKAMTFAVAPDGTIYGGPGPQSNSYSGNIWRRDYQTGAITTFVQNPCGAVYDVGLLYGGFIVATGPDGSLYYSAADYCARRIYHVSTTGQQLASWLVPGDYFVVGLAVGPDGTVYYTESANDATVKGQRIRVQILRATADRRKSAGEC